MALSILYLSIAALLPVIVAITFFLLDRNTKFNKINYWVKQVIYGVVFGALAIVGTHWGIPFNGVAANARDAAVIVAGLMFGGPGGIIAGFIGGIERFFGVYWFGLGSFTQIACSVSTILAGILSALLRRYLFNNKRPSVIKGFAFGVVIEVFHLFMVFVTNSYDSKFAFEVVRNCVLPMLLANGLSVLIAGLVLDLLEFGKKAFIFKELHRLTNRLTIRLFALVAAAFVLSTSFIFVFQTEVSKQTTAKTLERSIADVSNEVEDTANKRILELSHNINDTFTDRVNRGILVKKTDLIEWAETSKVTELNIVDDKGVIVMSNVDNKEGLDFHTFGEQGREFLLLIEDPFTTEVAQKYGPVEEGSTIYRKYAGVKNYLDGYGFIQIGYNTTQYHSEIQTITSDITNNIHVGDDGFICIADPDGDLVSVRKDIPKADLYYPMKDMKDNPAYPLNSVFEYAKLYKNENFYCYKAEAEGYTIVAALSVNSANFARDIAIYINTFLEIIIFALVFTLVHLCIKLIVNNKIDNINSDLGKITDGDLNVVLDGGITTEFQELATDINLTVDRLKEYIKEAASRIDKDLAAAKEIQASALPSRFPAYPSKPEFDVYALMQPAKEVGGDFYDFYTTHDNVFNINISDVSGKGIPAAMFMMRAKTELKSLTSTDITLDEVFAECNNNLVNGNEKSMFVTSWQGKIDLKTGALDFVNAGHNPPLIKHKGGKFEFLRSKPNMVLATFEGLNFNLNSYKLDPGDIVFLYTDGVTESINLKDEQFTENRLQTILNSRNWDSCEQICKSVLESVEKFTEGREQFDDITMLAFKYNGAKSSVQLKFGEASLSDISAITDFVNNELNKHHCPIKSKNAIDIAIDEIYSNIIKYSYPNSAGPTRVELSYNKKENMVSITFTDYGPEFNPLKNKAPNVDLPAELRAVGGLGIFVIKNMMTDITYKYEKGSNNLTIHKILDK